MNEQNERNSEILEPKAGEVNMQEGAAETATPPEESAPEANKARAPQEEAADDRENAPRGAYAAAAAIAAAERAAARRRARKKWLLIALAIAVVAGVAAGVLAYQKQAEREGAADVPIVEVTPAASAVPSGEALDPFEMELSGENQAVLEALSGELSEAESESNPLMEEADLTGEARPSDEAPEETAAPTVVVEYDGGQVMSDEVARAYEEEMTIFAFEGYGDEEIAEDVLNEVMERLARDRLMEQHAREMGLYELTEEDEKQIDARAQEEYEAQIEAYRVFVNTDGMTAEAAKAAVEQYLNEDIGIRYENIRALLAEDCWKEKLYNAIVADVTLDDTEVEESYNALLEEQKEIFPSYAESYEFAKLYDEMVVYNLPGYRTVRMLYFDLDSDDAILQAMQLREKMAALSAETDAAEIAQAQAEINSLFAAAEGRAAEALKALQSGSSFESLVDAADSLNAYGGLCCIAQDSVLWDEEIIAAAMALREPGEISPSFRADDGVYILEYVADVPEGEVPLDEVRDALYEITLSQKKTNAYEMQASAWLEEAEVHYYPERMQ